MPKFTNSQASTLAAQIRSQLGVRIKAATDGSLASQSLLAGLISVESAKNADGSINETSTRFEKGVYLKLLSVRDGVRTSYNNIHRNQLTGMSDAAIKNLATSYSLTQIMGYHLFTLKCTIAELRDPERHLYYACDLLEITSKVFLKQNRFEPVFRIWNSGSPEGKTYDPSYVFNALAVKSAYREI